MPQALPSILVAVQHVCRIANLVRNGMITVMIWVRGTRGMGIDGCGMVV